MKVRKKQCGACPWKKSTKPLKDIPGEYSVEKHCNLESTIAEPGRLQMGPGKMMACHESSRGNEYPCVGWLVHQLGHGNNIGLRIMALDGRFNDLQVEGEQHETFEDTLPQEDW